MSNEENIEILKDFLVESQESLDMLDQQLVELEEALSQESDFTEIVHAIFRGVHSMKGVAAFLELDNTVKLTHEAEFLLDALRKGKVKITMAHLDLLYRAGDVLRNLLKHIEHHLTDEGTEDVIEDVVAAFILASEGDADFGALKKEQESKINVRPTQENDFEIIIPEVVRLLQFVENHLTVFVSEAEHGELSAEVVDALASIKGHLNFLQRHDMENLADLIHRFMTNLVANRGHYGREAFGIVLRVIEGMSQALPELQKFTDVHFEFVPQLIDILNNLLESPKEQRLDTHLEERLGNTLLELDVISQEQLESALAIQEKPLGEILLEMKAISPEDLEKGLEQQTKKRQERQTPVAEKPGVAKPATAIASDTVRVDLQKLEMLGDLVGELVIAENMVLHHPLVQGEDFAPFRKVGSTLTRISREIQDISLSLRMVPVKSTFQKMNRVVRDTAKKVGKKVQLEIMGDDTEMDRNVVEGLSHPLVHLLRNAVDHGIELPREREQAGKLETGKVRLEARQEGGEIQIIIADDGRGINKESIIKKCIEKGLIRSDHVFNGDDEVFNLLFLPGFSTASQVSDISGRGVGMDVVKRNIEESLNGSIEITSKEGEGSRFLLRIPLTLSIIDGMLVRVEDSVITVPLLSIRETMSPKGLKITQQSEGCETVNIRNRLIPIVPLVSFLHDRPSELRDDHIMIVVEHGNHLRCLLVDEIIGQRQTVIKRLSGFLGNVRGVSGFSILSNGSITLILDVRKVVSLT
jgi:two-component system chemotaxis sensor kinase CheA